LLNETSLKQLNAQDSPHGHTGMWQTWGGRGKADRRHDWMVTPGYKIVPQVSSISISGKRKKCQSFNFVKVLLFLNIFLEQSFFTNTGFRTFLRPF
jgi:hypothetical protein